MKITTMVVPSYLDDWGLNPYEFRVYCRIARQAGKLESIASMAQACLMDAKSVRKAIKRLLADKLVRAIAAPGIPTRYELNPMDEWEAAKNEPLPDMVDHPYQIRHTTPTVLGSPTPTKSGIPPLPDPVDHPYQIRHTTPTTLGRPHPPEVPSTKDFSISGFSPLSGKNPRTGKDYFPWQGMNNGRVANNPEFLQFVARSLTSKYDHYKNLQLQELPIEVKNYVNRAQHDLQREETMWEYWNTFTSSNQEVGIPQSMSVSQVKTLSALEKMTQNLVNKGY